MLGTFGHLVLSLSTRGDACHAVPVALGGLAASDRAAVQPQAACVGADACMARFINGRVWILCLALVVLCSAATDVARSGGEEVC